MKLKSLLLGAVALAALAPSAFAERGADGNVNVIYWQAPSILNPFLSGGTKDVESASLILEPLARYDEKGNLVAWLAQDIPTAMGSRIHGLLHAIEGDFPNSAYWYRRAGKAPIDREGIDGEWQETVRELL